MNILYGYLDPHDDDDDDDVLLERQNLRPSLQQFLILFSFRN
jgi:hypothetical protein